MDRIVTASAARGTVSLVSGITTDLVREARRRHDLAPTASAAVGRLLTASALLGASLTGRERLTLQVVGDGPLGAVTADAWPIGPQAIGARAYALIELSARNGGVDQPPPHRRRRLDALTLGHEGVHEISANMPFVAESGEPARGREHGEQG